MSAILGLVERTFGDRIVACSIEPSPYASTQRLDTVDVLLDDGMLVALIAKHIRRDAVLAGSRCARSAALLDPRRERFVYERVLCGAPGSAALVAATADLLLLERVDGLRLCDCGALDTWCAAARVLADLHASNAGCLDRACRASSDGRAVVRSIAISGRLGALPVTVAHGDCFPANVIVPTEAKRAPVVVDWGAATVAPGLLDLAALTSGDWDTARRTAIADAYRDAAVDLGCAPRWWHDDSEFARDVAAARLHVALDQLAWQDGTRDWSADAATARSDAA